MKEDRFNFKLVDIPRHVPCLSDDIWKQVYELLPGNSMYDRRLIECWV